MSTRVQQRISCRNRKR